MTSSEKHSYGEGSVRWDRSSQRWIATIHRRDPVTGKSKPVKKYADTEKEADKALRALQYEKEHDSPLADGKTTIGAFITALFNDPLFQKRRAGRTMVNYRNVAKHYILTHISPNKVLSKLTIADIESMFRALQAEGRSDGTIQKTRTVLNVVLKEAKRVEIIPANIMRDTNPPVKLNPRDEIDPLDLDETNRVLKVLKDHRLFALAALKFATGLRSGETYGLQWKDLDLDNGIMTISKTLERYVGGWRLKQPKTQTGVRRIGLQPEIVDALRAHRARQSQEKAGSPHGFVFTSSVGGPVHEREIVRWWEATLKEAGVRYRRFYNTRHTAATLALDGGMPIELVSKMLGHKSIVITINYYAKTNSDDPSIPAVMSRVLGAAISDQYRSQS